MLRVKFKKLNDSTKLPYKGSLNAACYDVYVNSVSFKDGRVVYGLGFSTEIPVGYRGVIVPRSNLSKHKWVLGNSMGIIDADYRGEWMVVMSPLVPLHEIPLPYALGDRCAQIYFEPVLDVTFVETDDLSDTARGEGGFGSTGIK